MPKNKSHVRLSAINGGVARRYTSIPKAAEYIDAHPITIRKMIADGRIHAYRSGSRLIRVDLNEIDALMAGDSHGVA